MQKEVTEIQDDVYYLKVNYCLRNFNLEKIQSQQVGDQEYVYENQPKQKYDSVGPVHSPHWKSVVVVKDYSLQDIWTLEDVPQRLFAKLLRVLAQLVLALFTAVDQQDFYHIRMSFRTSQVKTAISVLVNIVNANITSNQVLNTLNSPCICGPVQGLRLGVVLLLKRKTFASKIFQNLDQIVFGSKVSNLKAIGAMTPEIYFFFHQKLNEFDVLLGAGEVSDVHQFFVNALTEVRKLIIIILLNIVEIDLQFFKPRVDDGQVGQRVACLIDQASDVDGVLLEKLDSLLFLKPVYLFNQHYKRDKKQEQALSIQACPQLN